MSNLHNLLNDIPFENLPPAWTTFDLASFSRAKTLWDYQQSALQNALKALWKYYADDETLKVSEKPLGSDMERKQRFFQWYTDHGIELDSDLNLGKKRDNASLLAPFYPVTESPSPSGRGQGEGKIPYQHFINRMGFRLARVASNA